MCRCDRARHAARSWGEKNEALLELVISHLLTVLDFSHDKQEASKWREKRGGARSKRLLPEMPDGDAACGGKYQRTLFVRSVMCVVCARPCMNFGAASTHFFNLIILLFLLCVCLRAQFGASVE